MTREVVGLWKGPIGYLLTSKETVGLHYHTDVIRGAE